MLAEEEWMRKVAIVKTKVQKLDEVMMITFDSTEIEFPALFFVFWAIFLRRGAKENLLSQNLSCK